MTYLYGDSTPFPLDYNYIEFLRELVALSVSLLRTEQALTAEHECRNSAQRSVQEELGQLQGLSNALQRSILPFIEGVSPLAVKEVAGRARDAVTAAVEGARSQAERRQDTLLRERTADTQAKREQLQKAVERFLRYHEFEGTVWDLSWKATGTGAAADAQGRAPVGLLAIFEIGLSEPPWSRAVRVSEFERDFGLRLLLQHGWLKKRKNRYQPMDKLFITEVKLTEERSSIVLASHPHRPSLGFEIVRLEGRVSPTVNQLDKQGGPIGEPMELSAPDGSAARRLLEKVEASLRPLISKRLRMVHASIDGEPLDATARPGELAEQLLGTAESLVREIRQRGSAAGELGLKRDIGSGRREEIYMTHSELLEKLSDVLPTHRNLFRGFGLSDDEVSGLLATTSTLEEEPDEHTPELPVRVETTRPAASGVIRSREDKPAAPPALPFLAVRKPT